ncbi:DUF3078 domain-containing protein [Flavobacterium caeni]|uniref:DUF3078 domain-containing protein n=1 Tax=Flavobacterium caeni TaxID=490189 RepID=A0A1G5JDV0_9FLAO|nr:DUF3078 domain-containing protein [Flavobacterium caeni]SCY86505.1 Protein of unknown function [Flavobacterium caeni]
MKKIVLLSLFFVGTMSIWAQEPAAPTPADTVKIWKSKGNFSLLLNQSSFSNWQAGGENNISGTVGINYDLNYKKDDWSWDNKVIASYGLVKTENSSFEKKTDDRFEFNSLLGKKAKGDWSYSFFLNFKTQLTKGYIYGRDSLDREIRTPNTSFLSPGYLTFGPGMLYQKGENLKINIAPATSKITFVDSQYTSDRIVYDAGGIPTLEPYVDGTYFGVDRGKSMRYELGFHASGYYKFAVMTNVTFENILTLYSNYLEDPQNVDLDYQLNVVMKINRYLTTVLSFQTIYDDNAFKGFQVREVFGLSVNIGF